MKKFEVLKGGNRQGNVEIGVKSPYIILMYLFNTCPKFAMNHLPSSKDQIEGPEIVKGGREDDTPSKDSDSNVQDLSSKWDMAISSVEPASF
jgi:hypothetical protein